MSTFHILSIETSCDETAIAILSNSDSGLKILTNQISSQVKLHAKWGGVVPNLAAREHVKNFPKLLKLALDQARITPAQIDLLAVTDGPGLIPALMVGVGYAKTLAYLWNKPLLGIHHIEGHIYANFISDKSTKKTTSKNENCKLGLENSPSIKFPILCLVVSGGHTQLVLMKDHFNYQIIGQTLDDAVGEAFDKVARILGIGYPGGPRVAQWASKFQDTKNKNQTTSRNQKSKNLVSSYEIQDTRYQIRFPRPMLNKSNFNFSFSGLKTAVLYETKKNPELLKNKDYLVEVCHEFQQACVEVLVAKTIKAARKYSPKTILLAGGVSANTELRKQLGEAISKNLKAVSYNLPAIELTGDNAAMIAAAAAFRFEKMTATQKKKMSSGWQTIQPNANKKLA